MTEMTRLYALLIAALGFSVVGQWAGAATADRRLVFLYAGLAALALIAIALLANLGLWRHAGRREHGGKPLATSGTTGAEPRAIVAAQTNARLISGAYAWGALSMLAVYLMSGLKWQHGWQYGCGMALIALAVLLYARQLSIGGSALRRPDALRWVARLTSLHAIALTLGLLWLAFSGKLDTLKSDWAANAIFLAGGIALVVLSDIAVATHARIARRV